MVRDYIVARPKKPEPSEVSFTLGWSKNTSWLKHWFVIPMVFMRLASACTCSQVVLADNTSCLPVVSLFCLLLDWAPRCYYEPWCMLRCYYSTLIHFRRTRRDVFLPRACVRVCLIGHVWSTWLYNLSFFVVSHLRLVASTHPDAFWAGKAECIPAVCVRVCAGITWRD